MVTSVSVTNKFFIEKLTEHRTGFYNLLIIFTLYGMAETTFEIADCRQFPNIWLIGF